MRQWTDALFAVYGAAVVALGAAVMYLYAPADAFGLVFAGLAIVLLAAVIGRILGATVSVIVTVALTVSLALLLGLPTGGASPAGDTALTLVFVALAGGGIGAYVAALSVTAEQARDAQRDSFAAAHLGVDLVPRALDEVAVGRLLTSLEQMTGAATVRVLMREEEGLSPLADDREPDLDQRRHEGVASLMLEPHVNASYSAASVRPLITTSSDAYLPVVSASGVAGIIYATRPEGAGPWKKREVRTLQFAAELLGSLLERDRYHAQATHLEASAKADELKSSILLSVSHDIKTPLAAAAATVSGLIESARESGNQRAYEHLLAVEDDLATLNSRIGELIDLSRLEGSSWKSNMDWNDVCDLYPIIARELSEAARDRVRFSTSTDTPPFRFDLVQVGRALHHIVENALLYSPPDSPVSVEVTYDAANVYISVTDEGPGVRPDEADAVFEKFHRGSAGEATSHGTGLGLAIALHIVKVHGGDIRVENVQPTGARFTIVLPRESEVDERDRT